MQNLNTKDELKALLLEKFSTNIGSKKQPKLRKMETRNAGSLKHIGRYNTTKGKGKHRV